MSDRALRVGMVGTFDVDNYGDRLFPLIAQAELAERLGAVDVHCFSYQAKTAAEWPFPVTSVTELPRLVPTLDGLLVGGGFLIRFDKRVAPGYLPPSPAIHHPTGYWLTPALLALQHGIPLLWNAPGVDYGRLPAWADPLLELALGESAYIAVRDEPSRDELARFVAADRIDLVPDTAFGVGRRLGGAPSAEFARLRDGLGLTGRYIIIQGTPGLEGCHRFLKRHAELWREHRLLALAVGPVNGDDANLPNADLPALVRLPASPHPFLLAEIIRRSAAVIGPSYHLAITALTAGVPVFTHADLSLGKFPGLAGLAGLFPMPDEGDDPAGFMARLGQSAVSPQVGTALGQLAHHWDRVAAVLGAGASGARGGRSDTAREAVGRFWQSLPGILEAASLQADALARGEAERQIAAAEAAAASGRERVAELGRVLTLARSEIARRDRRITQLLQSTSWKLSAPLRFVGRRLGR